jgi:signal transduction histidine kinase
MRPQQIDTAAGEFSRQELLERQILEIADHEKQHIGRELHDGLCQSLTGIAALCSVLSRSLAASGQFASAAAASEIVGLLNDAIGEARDIAHGLSGIGLNGTDLLGELETLARIVRDTYFASCTFACDRRCPRLWRGNRNAPLADRAGSRPQRLPMAEPMKSVSVLNVSMALDG